MINKVLLVGRVGKDPEVRYLNRGEQERVVVSFPLATSELVNDKKTGNKTELTEWHHIEMWDRNAENAAKILKKGRVVCIEGKIKSETWIDGNGIKRFSIKIRSSNFQVMSYLGTNPHKSNDASSLKDTQDEDDFEADDASFFNDSDNSNTLGREDNSLDFDGDFAYNS
jgi:single-strand DNA-binding protein